MAGLHNCGKSSLIDHAANGWLIDHAANGWRLALKFDGHAAPHAAEACTPHHTWPHAGCTFLARAFCAQSRAQSRHILGRMFLVSWPLFVPGGQCVAYVMILGVGWSPPMAGLPWKVKPPLKTSTSPGEQAKTQRSQLACKLNFVLSCRWKCPCSSRPGRKPTDILWL